MENIIEISNLSKSYDKLKAVDDLSFAVKKGQLFAFLGENGAGKSTTISIMCGTLKKDQGKIVINGLSLDTDLEKISAQIGVVFQNSVLDGVLSVKDNLYLRASLYGIVGVQAKERVKYLAKVLDFEDLLNKTVNKLSGGQRRRIDVARALIHNPKILILDEPTTGLDPHTRRTLWSVIENLRKKEKITVFLTTHYMEETADADYVVILEKGKISAEGTPLELKNKYTGDFVTVYHASESKIKKLGLKYEVLPDAIRISVPNTNSAKELIIKHPELFEDFEITKGKMDDVFLSVTGKKLEETL
ncbi:MAG: ABC transporter ATP-binding protein [Firmicutes bacterium]|nr:ABC transporter ATP-binding protein [Bacillota bacterium]MDY5676482.1 ABC transporter ATP-binding protein [Eubacteriales bacterium]